MSTTNRSKPLKVLWLTNIATPYRIPLWRWFAGQVELTIGLLSNTEQNRWWNFSQQEIGLDCVFLDVPAIRYGERSIYLPGRRLRKVLRTDWDVVILGGWESPAFLYALLVAKLKRIATVSHYGSTVKSHLHAGGVVDKVRTWFYRQLDAHATYGSEATNSLLGMGVQANQIFTGFNSVDHDLFHSETNKLRQGLTPTTGHKFLYVGQLLERKNVLQLVTAFSKIRKSEDSLAIVGTGPLADDIVALVAKLELGQSVSILGPKTGTDLYLEYAKADTLVLPSTNEVWGLVVNEALASGMHVVVSNMCGSSTDVKEMRGVYLCDTSIESIAEMLAASRTDWQGHIAKPEITSISTATYGKVFLEACCMSANQKQSKG